MKLSEIAREIGVDYSGEEREIGGINTLTDAKPNELSFLHKSKYAKDLENTVAAAVLIEKELASQLPAGVIPLLTDEPYLKLALASKLFVRPVIQTDGDEAVVGEGCVILPNVHIGRESVIGNNVTLMSGVHIGDNVRIGDDTIIYPNAVVYRDSVIGERCILHACAVIGSDGYGFAHTKDGEHVKIYQNGNVIVGNDVEIGAHTAVDRAVFGSTVIKDGCKIDNLVQIGHNAVIGEHSLLVSQVGISGSSTLGRNVVMAGQTATTGHLEIGEFATIHGRGVVTKSIPGHKHYGGFPIMEHRVWLKIQAMLAKMVKG